MTLTCFQFRKQKIISNGALFFPYLCLSVRIAVFNENYQRSCLRRSVVTTGAHFFLLLLSTNTSKPHNHIPHFRNWKHAIHRHQNELKSNRIHLTTITTTSTLNLMPQHAAAATTTIFSAIFFILCLRFPLKKVSRKNWNIRANVRVIYTTSKVISHGKKERKKSSPNRRRAWKMFSWRKLWISCVFPNNGWQTHIVQRRTGIIVVINSFMNIMKMEAHDITLSLSLAYTVFF